MRKKKITISCGKTQIHLRTTIREEVGVARILIPKVDNIISKRQTQQKENLLKALVENHLNYEKHKITFYKTGHF